MINSIFSLTFQLVRPYQSGGMKAREMLDWGVVEETCIHQSILCVLHSKGSCISWSQVVVVGTVTIQLGRASGWVSLQHWAGTKQIVRVMVENREANLKCRAWHREWLADTDRRITKHFKNNISGGKRRGSVTIFENFTPITSLEKQHEQMDPVGREKKYLLAHL